MQLKDENSGVGVGGCSPSPLGAFSCGPWAQNQYTSFYLFQIATLAIERTSLPDFVANVKMCDAPRNPLQRNGPGDGEEITAKKSGTKGTG